MKERKKYVVMAMLIGIICLVLSGCSKMTAEKLLGEMDKATEGKTAAHMEYEMDMDVTYAMNIFGMDMSMDMSMGMEMESWMDNELPAGYMNGNISINMMEMDISTNMEGYYEEEDGQIHMYSYSDALDGWTHLVLEMSPEEFKGKSDQGIFSLNSSSMKDVVLEDKTQDLDGREVYVLKVTIDGETLQEIMDNNMNSYMSDMSSISGMDLSDMSFEGITMPATCYVDKESYLPVQFEIEAEGMSEVINSLVESQLEDLEDSLLYGSEIGEDVQVDITNYQVRLKNISYEPFKIPPVPQEAKDTPVSNGIEDLWGLGLDEEEDDYEIDDIFDYEIDEEIYKILDEVSVSMLSDGTYVLSGDGQEISIPVPEGWKAEDLYYEVLLTNMETLQSYYYLLKENGYEEQFVEIYEEVAEGLDETMETGQEKQALSSDYGKLDVNWIDINGMLTCYTVIPLEHISLYVISEGYYYPEDGRPDPVQTLSEAFSGVKFK